MSLEGKVVVITGAEGFLGRVVTKRFLAEGAKVVLGWYASEAWEEARGLIPGDFNGQFLDVRVDATKEEQVENLMKKAKDAFGSLDILLHMVGLFHARGKIWETDTSLFERLVEVNLKTTFLCCKHALKIMLEKGRGHIMLFPPKVVLGPRPPFSAYAVSEAGLTALVSALREELKDTKITVNAIMPSVIDTPSTRKMPFAEAEKGVKTEEIADLLWSLCADRFDVLSGSILKVFGRK
ncbi:MAG TPA: SDR family NAD(P)-dependent oxidoreductase [Thermodesulfobacteriota bacterium]|nr:SDR family NAD(P)-dependent oxidoreductase [Thermodesulfobacteriota bacterium]